MTKILAELLGETEPDFRLGLARLEKASGYQSHDIRLTSEVMAATRSKLKQLGLDPNDTNGQELYSALAIKLVASDKELAKVLKLEPLEPSFLGDFATSAGDLIKSVDCFSLKSGPARSLFRKNPPKKAMKALGYRSLDSFLRHETIAGIFMAAKICESAAWHKHLLKVYKDLRPSDFEPKAIVVTALDSERWKKLAGNFVTGSGQNIFAFNEAGVIAVLPLDGYMPGLLTAMFLLVREAINGVLACGSYLRLHQVRSDFGSILTGASQSVSAPTVAGHNLSWRTIHNFIVSSPVEFEPQLASDSPLLVDPADSLAGLSPVLEFWRGTSHLAFLYGGRPVSLSPLDVAISYINKLSYESRLTSHFKKNLWDELWQHYLQAEVLAQKLIDNLRRELSSPELSPELILDETSN